MVFGLSPRSWLCSSPLWVGISECSHPAPRANGSRPLFRSFRLLDHILSCSRQSEETGEKLNVSIFVEPYASFPLYYGYLLLSCLLAGAVSFWYWVYLQNIVMAIGPALHMELGYGPGHFWSLAVEEQFYLFWPFVILFWPRRTPDIGDVGCCSLCAPASDQPCTYRHRAVFLYLHTHRQPCCRRTSGLTTTAKAYSTRRRAILCGIGLAGIVSLALAKHYGHATGACVGRGHSI